MNMTHFRNAEKQGFTIVELTIYSAFLLVFLYVMTTAFIGVIDARLSAEATSATAASGRYLFSRLAYDVGRAQAMIVPAAIGDQSSTLILQIGSETYTYGLLGNSVVLTNSSGQDALTGYDVRVSNLSFRRYGNVNGKHSVRVGFALTSVDESVVGADTRDFQTTLGLR